jgi:AcrR family transcriptional regulator
MEGLMKRKKISPDLKQDVVKIARQILKSEGIEGLDVRKLVKAVGCSIGTFYNHFKCLDDLIIHINSETLVLLKEFIFHDIDPKDSAKDIIKKICRNYIKYAKDNYAEWLLLLEYPVKMDTPEWYQKQVDDLFKEVSILFYKILRGPKKDTHRAVKVLWSSLHGITSLTFKDKLNFPDKEDTVELCQELFHNYILGYRIGLGIT